MPCDTVATARIKLDVATVNPTLLAAAIAEVQKAYPYTSIEVRADGRIDLRGGDFNADTVKSQVMKAYSKQIVMTQAKRFGWAVKEQPDGKMVLMKSRF